MMRDLFSRRAAQTYATLLLSALMSVTAAHAQRVPEPDPDDGMTFRAIALHDVRSDVLNTFGTQPEATAIDETTLANWFAWLADTGHHPVSLTQIERARAGGPPLPPRAVLLTFDDGYASAYDKVFPLLKQFRFPAVMALVTGWMDGSRRPQTPPQPPLMTWDQAREMARSGLVEFATHSHDMHRGILANPQGNLQPAASTLRYDPGSQRYETPERQARRIEADLRTSREIIESKTGQTVRAVVWPYGAYSDRALAAARRAGLPLALSLEEGPNGPDVSLDRIRRGLATYDMTVPDFTLLRAPEGEGVVDPINRAMHIDLDYVYDPDPVQQEANLSRLLERVLAIGPSSVFLQAFADPDGDGAADMLYFPNRHLPVRADLFNRVAWQLRTRTHVRVYAWMPVMAFRPVAGDPMAARTVLPVGPERYARLSSFDPAAREYIAEIYEDLAQHASFGGLLFHDDAMLADDEDASPPALAAYRAWGLPGDIAAIRADPAAMARWTAGKTRHLTDFTLMLADRVRQWHPDILTARNLFTRPILQPESQAWFAQDLAQSIDAYDYTAVMAMPYMEQADNPDTWLKTLVARVAEHPRGLSRTLFELQSRDWRTGRPIDDEVMARHFALLRQAGARHLAYYPDDFHRDQPALAVARAGVSVRTTLAGTERGLTTPPTLAPEAAAAPLLPIDAAATDRPQSARAYRPQSIVSPETLSRLRDQRAVSRWPGESKNAAHP